MKKYLNKIFVAFICLALCASFSVGSIFASANSEDPYELSEEETLQLQTQIEEIETLLSDAETDVESELSDFIQELDIEENQQLQDIASTTQESINDYIDYKNSQSQSEEGIASQGLVTKLICKAAVACATSYFLFKGYMLSAELLLHAYSNKTVGSVYSPSNGSRVKYSQVFTQIAYGSTVSGDATFNKGNELDNDLRNAIHHFHYYKSSANSRTVRIEDVYDYDYGEYDGVEGIAVNLMALSQRVGVIKPYNVRIIQSA